MPELTSYFNDFLSDIRPTETQMDDCQTGHKTLRDRLKEYDGLKDIIVTDFLQGSYARSTAIKPQNDNKLDVDIVVVTNIDESKYTPQQAFDLFKPFLEKYYEGKYKPQGRSWGIELSYVDLDLVITSAPSEIEKFVFFKKGITEYGSIEGIFSRKESDIMKLSSELEKWKAKPLRIPDRELKTWNDTNPPEQSKWTIKKNEKCNGNYVNLVKAIKWWRINKYPEQEYPKSYPLEHIIGHCCPDNISSVAEGVVLMSNSIIEDFSGSVKKEAVPILEDHGTDQNVLKRLTFKDFNLFYEQVKKMYGVAKKAYEETDAVKSAKLWYEIFGEPFPKPDDKGGYTPREKVSIIGGGRFS